MELGCVMDDTYERDLYPKARKFWECYNRLVREYGMIPHPEIEWDHWYGGRTGWKRITKWWKYSHDWEWADNQKTLDSIIQDLVEWTATQWNEHGDVSKPIDPLVYDGLNLLEEVEKRAAKLKAYPSAG
jgi:hypothetical protein